MAQRTPRLTRRPSLAAKLGRPGAGSLHHPNIAKGHYKPGDVALLWIAEGGPPKYARAMGVVSHFENSSGDPKVVNSIGATGLLQIYNGPNTNTRALQNPRTNIRAGIKKFKDAQRAGGTGFEPWVSSQGGWGDFVDVNTGKVNDDALRTLGISFPKTFTEGLATGPIGDIAAAGANVIQPLTALGELAIGLTELLLTPEGWRRILKVVIGGVILIWALNQLGKSTLGVNPARGVRKIAKTTTAVVATKGAVT